MRTFHRSPCDEESRERTITFEELSTRQDARYTVVLEWDRDTGATQVVLADHGDASLVVFPVLGADAADAFRHPLGYAP